jgi:hypothetical protein
MGRAIVNRTFTIEGWVCKDGYCVKLVKSWTYDQFITAEMMDICEAIYKEAAEQIKATYNFEAAYKEFGLVSPGIISVIKDPDYQN